MNKNNKKSLEYCEKGLSVVEIYPLKGIALMEECLLKKLLKEIRKND